MADKTQPLGICDLCLGEIHPDRWYTRRGPRLYCSRECRNTANSRSGAKIRSRKAKERVRAGIWQNPAKLNPPTPAEQAKRARKGRKREVAAGTWRNPALSAQARKKLSRPRKHGDNPTLHSAIEKLSAGQSVSDLTPAEAETYRAYRRKLRRARKDEVNRWHRRRYHRRQATMTEEEREAQRARWRANNHRRAKKKKHNSE